MHNFETTQNVEHLKAERWKYIKRNRILVNINHSALKKSAEIDLFSTINSINVLRPYLLPCMDVGKPIINPNI